MKRIRTIVLSFFMLLATSCSLLGGAHDAKAKEVRNNKDLKSPIVMIKATDVASWESVIGALDEMSISEISIYQIENLNDLDRKMLGLPVETPEAAPAQ